MLWMGKNLCFCLIEKQFWVSVLLLNNGFAAVNSTNLSEAGIKSCVIYVTFPAAAWASRLAHSLTGSRGCWRASQTSQLFLVRCHEVRPSLCVATRLFFESLSSPHTRRRVPHRSINTVTSLILVNLSWTDCSAELITCSGLLGSGLADLGLTLQRSHSSYTPRLPASACRCHIVGKQKDSYRIKSNMAQKNTGWNSKLFFFKKKVKSSTWPWIWNFYISLETLKSAIIPFPSNVPVQSEQSTFSNRTHNFGEIQFMWLILFFLKITILYKPNFNDFGGSGWISVMGKNPIHNHYCALQ